MKGTEPGFENTEHHAEKDALEELFRHATARERPTNADEQAIRDRLLEEWQALTAQRRRRKAFIPLAAAASVILAALVVFRLTSIPEPAAPAIRLASVGKHQGAVLVHPADQGEAFAAAVGAVLESGQRIVSSAGSRLGMKWRDGTSLRVDQNSEIRFTASGEIELISGRIFVDTEKADKAAAPLVVLTPAGQVRHLGTQYMTAFSSGTTRISVREGKVALNIEGKDALTNSGEQLIIDAAGLQSRKNIPVYGAAWQWIETLAPAFSSDGRSISDLLDWVSRETGRPVEFQSTEAATLAMNSELRGEVDMEPMRALTVMLQTSDLSADVNNGIISVSVRTD